MHVAVVVVVVEELEVEDQVVELATEEVAEVVVVVLVVVVVVFVKTIAIGEWSSDSIIEFSILLKNLFNLSIIEIFPDTNMIF